MEINTFNSEPNNDEWTLESAKRKWIHLKEKDVVMTRFFTAKIPEQQGYYEKREYHTFDEIVMMGKELM